ncbi:hypothetical protein KPL74_14670 [Bacillus sp. NP157]|nr:hypothetical protein KPL74_14670 [Bacillus sp. NP157]
MLKRILLREMLGLLWALGMSGIIELIYSPLTVSYFRLAIFFGVIAQVWVLLAFVKNRRARP